MKNKLLLYLIFSMGIVSMHWQVVAKKTGPTTNVTPSFKTAKEKIKVLARDDIKKKQMVLTEELEKDEQKIIQAMSEYQAKFSMLSDSDRRKEKKKLMKMERDYQNKLRVGEEELKAMCEKWYLRYESIDK